ncbi:MAG TPA: hypothetical protein VFA41_24375 [Ktedonobacteraceae bacterium]|jgi:hypothetical protein|nr:hypothetical protein [Ktedonobacteraceae bacterium]
MPKAGRFCWLLLLITVLAFIQMVGSGLLSTTAFAAAEQPESSGDTCTSTNRLPAFGGSITVGTNEVRCSELVAFGSQVEVQGTVQGNIIAFGSHVDIQGGVLGDITLFGGSLHLYHGSLVRGNITLYGASISKDVGAQRYGVENDHPAHGPTWGGFPFWFIFTLVPLGLLFTWLLPEHVMFVRATLSHKLRRSLIVGLLTLVLAPFVFVILLALIVSIPLAFILILGLVAAWALGIVAAGWNIGEYVLKALGVHYSTRYLQVVVGLIAIALLGSLPMIGWLVWLGAGLAGIGAVFLSRFGTRLFMQPRQPLTM